MSLGPPPLPTPTALVALERWLDATCAEVQQLAQGTSLHSLGPWDALLHRCHLVPPPADLRAARFAALALPQGVPPEELRATMQVIARLGAQRLTAIQTADPQSTGHHGALGARCGVLRSRLLALVDVQGAHYDKTVRPPTRPGGGLGSIFARARTSAAVDPWASVRWQSAVTLECVSCGAPQEAALEFTCQRCRNVLFREEDGWD